MKALKQVNSNTKVYFDTLPQSTRDIIEAAILNAAENRNGPEGYIYDKEALEPIECHSRDGFICASHNCGGLRYRNFTDLIDYFGGGHTVAHETAAKEIQRQIDYSLECVQNDMAEDIGKSDMQYYFDGDKSKLSYHNLDELSESLLKQGQTDSSKVVQEWRRQIEDKESNYLAGGENSIMHEIRIMYHGKENGVHTASISAAVNTEGPYHRSSISWAPNVFCEGAKEIEITWKNNTELKRKLDKALKQVSKAIF